MVKTRKRLRRRSPRVALLVESSNAYGRGLLAGIAEYLQAHGPWSTYLPEIGRADSATARLRGWEGDGILVRAEDREIAETIANCSSSVIDLSAAGLLPDAPVVHSDVRAEAALGFEHLWERGFRHLGFCGVSDYRWVGWQQEQFCKLASMAGADISSHIEPLRWTQAGGWKMERNSLGAWLKLLPKPVGIFACYDLLGQQVLDVCRTIGLRIPDDVAVVGVDDDAVRCSLSDPPLSSVAPNTRKIGFKAAEMLARMMAGERIEKGMKLVAPLGVTARRSTDALAVADADVAAALRFIRDHCGDPITVSSVINEIPLSRRSLESRFLRSVGRTPHAEIERCRVERAKQLLTGTDLPVKVIAAKVGVTSPEYLSVMFRRLIGMSPSVYRGKPSA